MTSFFAAWQRLDDARHRAEWYRSWEALAGAGFTIPVAMEMIGARESVSVERARLHVLQATRRGGDVGTAVRGGSAHFSPFEQGMLALGAETGRLERSLSLLGSYFTRKHRWMLTVRKRMAYPIFTAVCATFIAPFPLAWTGHLAAYAGVVMLGLAFWASAGGAIVLVAADRYARTPALVRARFARALASAIEAGSTLSRAARLAADSSGDAAVQAFVAGIGDTLLGSRPLSTTLAHCPRMSNDLLAVLATAERTGDYATTLTRLAELYEDGFR